MNSSYKVLEKKASFYCAKSEKCEFDVRRKLTEWGASKEVSDKVTDFLIDNNFINEQRYTNAFVHDAIYLKNWGKIKIRQALLQKRINRHVIDEALKNIDQNYYEQNMKRIIEHRLNSQELTDNEKMKIVKSLYSRGFELEILMQIITNH